MSTASGERLFFLLAIPLVVSFVFGWPSTDGADVETRAWTVVYWITGVLPLWWLDYGLARLGSRWMRLRRGPALWLWLAITPVPVFVTAAVTGFFTIRLEFFASTVLPQITRFGAFPAQYSPEWFVGMLRGSLMPCAIWLIANALHQRLFGRLLTAYVEADAAPGGDGEALTAFPRDASAQPRPATAPSFLERLDKPLRGRVIAIQAQEHYIRVHTDQGASLALYRFSDALAQLRAERGIQVHRSYWIRIDAVRSIERSQGRSTIVLSNGVRVPVSRRYEGAVRHLVTLDCTDAASPRTHPTASA